MDLVANGGSSGGNAVAAAEQHQVSWDGMLAEMVTLLAARLWSED
jgi:hypothetical protein